MGSATGRWWIDDWMAFIQRVIFKWVASCFWASFGRAFIANQLFITSLLGLPVNVARESEQTAKANAGEWRLSIETCRPSIEYSFCLRVATSSLSFLVRCHFSCESVGRLQFPMCLFLGFVSFFLFFCFLFNRRVSRFLSENVYAMRACMCVCVCMWFRFIHSVFGVLYVLLPLIVAIVVILYSEHTDGPTCTSQYQYACNTITYERVCVCEHRLRRPNSFEWIAFIWWYWNDCKPWWTHLNWISILYILIERCPISRRIHSK